MRWSILAIAFLPTAPAIAQDEGSLAPILADGFVSYGTFVQRETAFGLTDWRNALPESDLLRADLPQGGQSYGYGWGPGLRHLRMANGTGSAYLGISLDPSRGASEAARFMKRLRLAVNLAGDDFFEGSWGESSTGVYDTLVSQQTGAVILLDSTWSESRTASMYRSRVAFDASYVVRKASPRRLTWYCGIGVLVGLTFEGQADVSHFVNRRRETIGSNGWDNEYNVLGSERFRLPSTFFAAGLGLFGLDFTLGRVSPFWSSLHLFNEARVMLRAGSLPGQSMGIQESAQYLFGLRFDLR